MAGGIFYPLNDVENIESCSRNPLLCYLCNELYEEPCLLNCYHTFCSKCLRGRSQESKMVCPLCGKLSPLKDGCNLPSPDPLLHFLVESSCEERPPCANCDKNDPTPMFFCNTCGQALCGPCREDTHRAKMFSAHDIIHMSKRTKDSHKKCTLHGEPFIMFSTAKKTMLCIHCFRDTAIEARLHCIDLDTAYSQGCKKLERAVMSLRELQNSVKDGVILFKALLEELKRNMETEKCAINVLSENLQEIVRKTQEFLLQEVDNQYENKDKLFRSQLASLGTLLPTIQVHLIMCTTFASSASKYEFLDLGYALMERLAAICHLSHPLRPSQSSQIKTNYKGEFARNLESLISEKPVRELGVGTNGSSDKLSHEDPHQFGGQSLIYSTHNNFNLGFRRAQGMKMKILEGSGPFSDHCKAFENRFRELSQRFKQVKDDAQELHRDVTLRRCLTRKGGVESIVAECSQLESDIRKNLEQIEGLRPIFDKVWDEQLQQVYAEQELFQSQTNDLQSMQFEADRVIRIVQQLDPYIKTISSLMERISPHLHSGSQDLMEEHVQALMDHMTSLQSEAHRIENSQSDKLAALTLEDIMQPRHSLKAPVSEKKGADFTPIREELGNKFSGKKIKTEEDINNKKGFLTQLLDKVRGSEDKRKAKDLINKKCSRSSSQERHSAPEEEYGEREGDLEQDEEGGFILQRTVQRASLPSTLSRGERATKGSVSDTECEFHVPPLPSKSSRFKLRERENRRNRHRSPDMDKIYVNMGGQTFIAVDQLYDNLVHEVCQSAGLQDRGKVEDRLPSFLPDCINVESGPHDGRMEKSHLYLSHGNTDNKEKCYFISPQKASHGEVLNHYETLEELKLCQESIKVKAIIHQETRHPIRSPIKQHSSPDFTATIREHKKSSKKNNSCENLLIASQSFSKDKRNFVLNDAHTHKKNLRKQNSWEGCSLTDGNSCRHSNRHEDKRTPIISKADSFEGHEEAVKTLVAAVQESKNMRRKKK